MCVLRVLFIIRFAGESFSVFANALFSIFFRFSFSISLVEHWCAFWWRFAVVMIITCFHWCHAIGRMKDILLNKCTEVHVLRLYLVRSFLPCHIHVEWLDWAGILFFLLFFSVLWARIENKSDSLSKRHSLIDKHHTHTHTHFASKKLRWRMN